MFLQGTPLELHVDTWAQVGDGSFTLADEAAVRMLLIQEAYLLCRQMGCDGVSLCSLSIGRINITGFRGAASLF